MQIFFILLCLVVNIVIADDNTEKKLCHPKVPFVLDFGFTSQDNQNLELDNVESLFIKELNQCNQIMHHNVILETQDRYFGDRNEELFYQRIAKSYQQCVKYIADNDIESIDLDSINVYAQKLGWLNSIKDCDY